jgi:hypothetical protein
MLKPNGHLFIFYPAIDIFPQIILKQIKFISKLLFFNLEEYSSFIKMKELERIADDVNLRLVTEKTKMLHRFILFIKK